MFALVWSLGSTGTEAGQRAFLEFLENIVADLGVIEAEWEGVSNALQVTTLQARGFVLLTHPPPTVNEPGADKLGVPALLFRSHIGAA